MRRTLVLALLIGLARAAGAVEVPPEGQCPPYPLRPGQGAVDEDVTPPLFREGERIERDKLPRARNFLPSEVWARREIFFYDGMSMQIGPCHRRYPAPPFFDEATDRHAGEAKLDSDGNLIDYSGEGLPFRWQDIRDDDPQAGLKWAWISRYRYQGAGLRGDFRVLLVARRGRKVESFTGGFFLIPTHGVPGLPRDAQKRFWAGGEFKEPSVARGVAWRQYRPEASDRDQDRSDEIWVYVPQERKVRRAPPTSVDGVFTPSYTRGESASSGKLHSPDGKVETPDPTIAVVEHTRAGFTGIYTRPNAYAFRFAGVHDVLAPINSVELGYPGNPDRSYGPTGLSLGSDRWELRRAVVIEGERRQAAGPVHSQELWIDALTQQPLYVITRKENRHIYEVGILMGRFSGDDGLHPRWEGSGRGFGTIVPVAASFFVAGEGGGWLRESYDLRSDPPSANEQRDFTTVRTLSWRGR
jgi:hypothetical protein